MAHCTKCGAVVADNAGFCAACGAPNVAAAGATPVPSAAPASSPGATAQTPMAENVAGTLCYALLWVSGLIFYFIDKRPFVRFHAAQSIVVFGTLTIINYVLNMFFETGYGWGYGWGWGSGFSFFMLIHDLVWLVGVIFWILLMIKAHQGERFHVPIAADIAESIFGKS